MNANNFTDEERRLIKLSDEDTRKMITYYKEGELYTLEFISSLNLDNSKRECVDYNEHVKRMRYYQEQVKSFSSYLDTMDDLNALFMGL